jgi:FtsP/CotA-like multicopper oxidase with cupredoxin domain
MNLKIIMIFSISVLIIGLLFLFTHFIYLLIKKSKSDVGKRKGTVTIKYMAFLTLLGALGTGITTSYQIQNVQADSNINPTQPSTATNATAANATNLNMMEQEINQQNKTAVDMMNEESIKPNILSDGTKQFNLTASKFAWSLYPGKVMEGWGFNHSIPGSLMRVKVGDKVDIVVHNTLTEPMTVHWHGLQVPNAMDGVPGMPNPAINPNGTFEYKFTVTEQMVGTHWYHSHYNDDFQVDAGMYGVIIVDPKDNSDQTHYDVDKLFTLGATKVDGVDPENVFMINGKSYPYTPELNLKKGQRVLLRLVNSSAEDYHAVSLDGYNMTIVAEDGQPLPDPQAVNVVSLAPSETLDVTFTADRIGDWWFHSTIASELSNPDDNQDTLGGMMTVIHVK